MSETTDADRLDWLERHHGEPCSIPLYKGTPPLEWAFWNNPDEGPSNLREAIDAAMRDPQYDNTGDRLSNALGVDLSSAPAKRARLEREIVEASLRLRRSTLALKKVFDEHDENTPPDAAMEIYELSGEDVKAREAFDAATDALIDFESQQGIQK